MAFNKPKKPKRLMIQIPTKRHTELKMLAAELETTMNKLVNKLIQNELNKEIVWKDKMKK